MKKFLFLLVSLIGFISFSFGLSQTELFIDSYISNALSKYDKQTQVWILVKADKSLEELLNNLTKDDSKKPILQMIHTVVKHRIKNTSQIVNDPIENNINLNKNQKELFDKINATRVSNNLVALKINPTLQSLAQWHVDEMVTHNYFSHTNLAWKSSVKRVEDSGYKFSYVGETLANTAINADVVVNGRLNSPLHRDILLSDEATEIWIWYNSNWSKWTALYANPL